MGGVGLKKKAADADRHGAISRAGKVDSALRRLAGRAGATTVHGTTPAGCSSRQEAADRAQEAVRGGHLQEWEGHGGGRDGNEGHHRAEHNAAVDRGGPSLQLRAGLSVHASGRHAPRLCTVIPADDSPSRCEVECDGRDDPEDADGRQLQRKPLVQRLRSRWRWRRPRAPRPRRNCRKNRERHPWARRRCDSSEKSFLLLDLLK
eukprot:scaffold12322_cov110-Isochrysis_galbana.AAC.5